MAPVCEDLTKSSIHTLLNALLTLILHSVPMQVLLPKAQSNLGPSKPWFLHNCILLQAYGLRSNWTSSCLHAAFTLLCALRACGFAMWSTATRQIEDTSRGHWCANTTKTYGGHQQGHVRTRPDLEQKAIALWGCSGTSVLIEAVFPIHILVDESYQRKSTCSLMGQGLCSVWRSRSGAVAERQAYAKDGNDVNVMGWRQLQLWVEPSETATLRTPLTACGCIFHTNLYALQTHKTRVFLCYN